MCHYIWATCLGNCAKDSRLVGWFYCAASPYVLCLLGLLSGKLGNHDLPCCGWGGLAPVSLTIFRSNSKLNQSLQSSGLRYTQLITTKFCTCHDSVAVIGCVYFKLEHSKFWSKFEFDRHIVSGTGVRANTDDCVEIGRDRVRAS